METERRFPILGPERGEPFVTGIPWSLAEAAHKGYESIGHRQSLERIAERGGFGTSEVVRYLADAMDAGLVVLSMGGTK